MYLSKTHSLETSNKHKLKSQILQQYLVITEANLPAT